MSFYDDEKNVRGYIDMVKGSDGRELIKILRQYLPAESSLLELGMGPGKDLNILKKTYRVIGSDSSQAFLDIYKQKNKEVDVMLLDAKTLATKKKFDCIYSNKVLHHLSKPACRQSFQNQRDRLKKNGLLFHSFWYGNKTVYHHGLRFTHYTEKELVRVIDSGFKIILMQKYREMKKDDSILLILQKI